MKQVGLIKRLMVLIYDGFLLAGVMLVTYVPLYLVFTLLPESFEPSLYGQALKISYLTLASFLFYGWFWTHGGQTLGMRAWHLFLVDGSGKFIGWGTAAIRYVAAVLSWGLVAAMLYFSGIEKWFLAIGVGFTWILTNRAGLAWHDILSGTRIVYMKKKP